MRAAVKRKRVMRNGSPYENLWGKHQTLSVEVFLIDAISAALFAYAKMTVIVSQRINLTFGRQIATLRTLRSATRRLEDEPSKQSTFSKQA